MNYTVYNIETGQIEKTVSCQESDVSFQFDDATHGHLEGTYRDDIFYIEDGIPVAMHEKPSDSHVFNYTTKQWEDPRTLQDLKDAQWSKIKQSRSAAEYAGFTWDGSTFDSDATSQNRITGAVALAQMSSAFSIGWILADNSTRTLNQTDMCLVGQTLGVHVATQFAKGVVLRALIEAATTKEEVEAVVW